MYKRKLKPPLHQSYFLLGPRGVGKSTFLKQHYKKSIYIDLLHSKELRELLAFPENLEKKIPSGFKGWVILDEIQKHPILLNEVHRFIEDKKIKFILSGSSARKLRAPQVNLLAGRALNQKMYPLTAEELGKDFKLLRSLKYGHIPQAYTNLTPKKFLSSYVDLYIQGEIQQERMTQNLSNFVRFLEVASFSQGSPLSLTNVSRKSGVKRKTVENYFSILEDTLFSYRLKPFQKRAKRHFVQKHKFYFFDVGIFQELRPSDIGSHSSDRLGIALESLVLQEIRAQNEYKELGYDLSYWRTHSGREVDFILSGARGFKALEIKYKKKLAPKDFLDLESFQKEHPECELFMIYLGKASYPKDDIRVISVEKFLRSMTDFI